MAAAFYGRVIKWNLQWGFQRVSCVLTHDKRDSKQRKWGGRERSKKQYTLARQPALFFFFFFLYYCYCVTLGAETHLFLSRRSAAVSGGQSGGAGLRVPRHVTVLRGAADGKGPDGIGVTVAVAVVVVSTPVARRPHEYRALASTSLWKSYGNNNNIVKHPLANSNNNVKQNKTQYNTNRYSRRLVSSAETFTEYPRPILVGSYPGKLTDLKAPTRQLFMQYSSWKRWQCTCR